MGTGSSPASKGGGGKVSAKTKIHKFPDKASGSHEYEGDGRDTVRFFEEHTNADKLIDSMSREERSAFRDWASGDFMDGQQYGGWDNMSSIEQKQTRIFDKFLDQSVTDTGFEVTRLGSGELVLGAGEKTGKLADYKKMIGEMVVSKGSMSTGAASEGLTIGSIKQVEYAISVPAGAKGAGMWIGDKRINHWGDRQREYMTNRDSVFRVKNVSEVSRKDFSSWSGAKGSKTYIRVELEWVGLQAHDYGESKTRSRKKSS